ncbi:MAG: hypothetical protein ABEI52_11925, partial [Halobacteriaceae archaeon]
ARKPRDRDERKNAEDARKPKDRDEKQNAEDARKPRDRDRDEKKRKAMNFNERLKPVDTAATEVAHTPYFVPEVHLSLVCSVDRVNTLTNSVSDVAMVQVWDPRVVQEVASSILRHQTGSEKLI